jgi:tetratricopeptide (TPR) repeat protein
MDGGLMESPSSDAAAALQAIHDQGLAHHQAGRLEEARRCYEQVLAVDPRHFDSLHLFGVYHIQTGQLEAAVELIRRAIAVKADVAGAYGNLANALNSLRRYDDVLEACERAIALTPDFAEAHGNRGQALHQLQRLPEALTSYERVVALKPTAQAYYNQATMLRELGRLEDALASYDRAIALKPDHAESYRSRGIVLCDLKRPHDGLESYERAIALKPDDADVWRHRGVALRELGRPSDALASQDQAIMLRPTYAEAHGARGNALSDLQHHAEALASYELATVLKPDYAEAFSNKVAPLRELQRLDEALAASNQAIALRPDYAEGHNNRGGALYDLRCLDEALASYERALVLKPDYAEAHNNKGVVLYELRRLDEALASYERSLALRPDFADAHHSLAMCQLMLGDFAAGWAHYEWRWRTAQFRSGSSDPGAPAWLGGEDLQGRTILLRSEQGLGDTLQFCRYVPEVAALGAEVILEVQPGLERLLERLDGVVRVVTRGQMSPHDFQTPLMSLPLALGAAPDVSHERYLEPDPRATAAWASRLAGTGKRRVGLCWAGGVRPDQLVANSIDKRRSLSLEAFAPLAGVEGVEFYSLQKGPPAAQLAELQAADWAGPAIIDLTPELQDFADSAALVANLDLVITCDTAIAHLAGGLGTPVWILNRFDACWRWLNHRTDSPWYPSARLFRQPAPGDWTSVIDEVRRELRALPYSHAIVCQLGK